VLLALALIAGLLAHDAAAIRHGMKRGDLTLFEDQPTYEEYWSLGTSLPFADEIFGIDDDLVYRQALRKYAAQSRRQAARYNFSSPGLRAEAQAALADAENSGLSPQRRSKLANLQGVLSYDETIANPGEPALIEQTLSLFQRAIQTDPSNTEAKYNLEYLFRLFNPRANQLRLRQFNPANVAGRSAPGGGSNRTGQGY
jgi:hypothetical protein